MNGKALSELMFSGRPVERVSLFEKAVPNIRGTYHYTMFAGKRKRYSGVRPPSVSPNGKHKSWPKVAEENARVIKKGFLLSGENVIKEAKKIWRKIKSREYLDYAGNPVYIPDDQYRHILGTKYPARNNRNAKHIRLLLETIKDPIEVWEKTDSEGKTNELYLSAFESEDSTGFLHHCYSAVRVIREGKSPSLVSFVVPGDEDGVDYIEKNVRSGKRIFPPPPE